MKGHERMNEAPVAAAHRNPDGLWRWLVGGLAAGGAVLGLLIAAYAIGYHHGRHHAAGATAAATTTKAPAPTPTTTATLGPIQVTAALVARGKVLYASDGCSACHSLTGTAGAGPSFKGLAGEHEHAHNGTGPWPATTPTWNVRSPTPTHRSSRVTTRGSWRPRSRASASTEARRHPRTRRVDQIAEVTSSRLDPASVLACDAADLGERQVQASREGECTCRCQRPFFGDRRVWARVGGVPVSG